MEGCGVGVPVVLKGLGPLTHAYKLHNDYQMMDKAGNMNLVSHI